MATDKEASCLSCASDPNFAVICSFLDKFSNQCGITYPPFAELQGMLEDTQTVSQVLVDLHVKLLRKARKSFTADKWEKALAKFCHTYSQQDGWELERFGYKKARLEVKVKLLKVLLETQFDVNAKFKSEVNKLPPADLRLEPLGRDQTGLTYWCQFDPSSNIRVYREDADEESWELVAKDRDGLVKLIDSLSNGEGQLELNNILNEDSMSQEIEKPITDTGQNAAEEEGEENEDLEDEEDEEIDNDGDNEEEKEEEEVVDNTEAKKEEIKEELKQTIVKMVDEEIKKEENCIQENPVNGNTMTFKNKIVEKGVSNSSDTNESCLSGVDLSIKPEPRNYSVNSKQGSFYMMPDRDPLPETADILSQMSMRFNEKRFAEDLSNPNKKTKLDIAESGTDENQPMMLVKKNYNISESSDQPLSLVSGATIQRVKEDSNSQHTVSEVIEEPVHYITGSGSGAECNDGKPGFTHEAKESAEEPEFGEVIEEPILYIRGEGSGADCDVGNTGRLDESNLSPRHKSSEFLASRKKIVPHEETDQEEKFDVLSEAIEEPVFYIKGLGSGVNCDVGNPKQFTSDHKEQSSSSTLVPEFSNVIEEPVHYIRGNGLGAECGVGSPRHVRDQSRNVNSNSFATMGIECSMNRMTLSEYEHTFSEVIEEPVMFVRGCGYGQDCLTGNDEKEESINILKPPKETMPPDQSSDLSNETVGTKTEINSNEPSLLKSLSEVKPAEENIPMKDKPPDLQKWNDDEKKLDHLSNSVQDISNEKLNSKLTTSHLVDNNIENNSISCNNNVDKKPSESSDQVSSKQNSEDCAVDVKNFSEESVSDKLIKDNKNIFSQNKNNDLNNSNVPLKNSNNGIITENGPSKDDLGSSEKIKKECSEENDISSHTNENCENNIDSKKINQNLSGEVKFEIKSEEKTEDKVVDDKIKKEASVEKTIKEESISLANKENQEMRRESDDSDLDDDISNKENDSKKEGEMTKETNDKTKKTDNNKEKNNEVENEKLNPKKKCDSDNEENDEKNIDSEKDESDEKVKTKTDSKEENTNDDSKQVGKGRKSRTNSLNDENDTDIPNKKPKTDTTGKVPARRSLRRTASSNSQPNEAKKVQNKKETKKTENVVKEEEDKEKSNKKSEDEQDKEKSNKKNEKKETGSKKESFSLSNFSMDAPDEDGSNVGKSLKNQNRKRRSSMRLSRSEEEGADILEEEEEEEVGGKKPRLKGKVKKTKGKLTPAKPPPPESSSDEEDNEEGEDEEEDDEEEEKNTENNKKASKQLKGKGKGRTTKSTRSVRPKSAAATTKKKTTQVKKTQEETVKGSKKKPSPKKVETTPSKKEKIEAKRKGNETKKGNDTEAPKKKGKAAVTVQKNKKVTPIKKRKSKDSVPDESESEDENKDDQDDEKEQREEEKEKEKGEVEEEHDLKAEENQDESTPNKEEKKPRGRRCSKKKTLLGLTEWDLAHTKKVQESAGLESTDGGNVRASRRLAQIKIKEEAERRAIEEAALHPVKEKKKTKKQEDKKESPKKTKKRKGKGDRSSEEDETFKEPKEEKKRKKKRKGLKFDENRPWQSSSGSSSDEAEEEDDHFEEEEDEEDIRQKKIVSDHEFSPESDLEKDDEGTEGVQPIRRARTAKKGKAESEVEDEEEEQTEDYPCKKCGLPNHPEWILLCDKCDSGYHASCLRPPLMLIPEGDWFCPPCQHADLVVKLKEALRTFEKDTKKRENEELRRKRLAYVGISLANVIPTPEKKESGHHRRQIQSSSEEYSSEEESESSEEEPVYQLRQRRAAVQANYRFNDYDELINSAIQDEMDAVKGAGNMGRGKDIQNIVEAEKNLPEENEEKEDAEEEVQDENWRPRVVPKITALPSLRKKPKKITDLDDIPSDDDRSDEDFKGSSAEEYSTSGGGDSDDSIVMIPVRRSERTRQARIDREFINDSSESSDEPRRKKTRKLYASSSSESSGSWSGRRKRKSKSYNRVKSSRTKKKSTRYFDSDDSDRPKKVKSKRPKIRYGLSEDDEPVKTRTRGKRVSYLDVAGSDTEEEVIRRSRKLPSDDEDEFVPEKEDVEVEEKVKRRVISSTEEESEEGSDRESSDEEKEVETANKKSASEKSASSAAEDSEIQNPKPEIVPQNVLADNQKPLKDMKQPAVIVERIKSIDNLGQRSIASEDDDEVEEEEIEEEIEEEVEEEEEEEIEDETEAGEKNDAPKDLAIPKVQTDEAIEMKKELERKGVTLMAVNPPIAPQQPTPGYRPNQIPMGIRPPFAPQSMMVGRPPLSQPPALVRPPHSQPMPARPPPTQPPVVVHSSRMQPSVLVQPSSAQSLVIGQAPPPPRAVPVRASPQSVPSAQLISKAPSPIQPVTSATPPQQVATAPPSQPVPTTPPPQTVSSSASSQPASAAPPPSQPVPSTPPPPSVSSSTQKTSIKAEPPESKKEEKEEKKEPVPTIRLVPSAKLIDPNKARRPIEEGVIRGMLGGGGYYRPPLPQQRVGQPTLPPAGYGRQRFPEPHQRYMYQPPHQLPPSHQFYPQAGYYPGGSGDDYGSGSGYDDQPPPQTQVITVGGGGGGGEEDGVFSGLVSYFSSQREDSLDS